MAARSISSALTVTALFAVFVAVEGCGGGGGSAASPRCAAGHVTGVAWNGAVSGWYDPAYPGYAAYGGVWYDPGDGYDPVTGTGGEDDDGSSGSGDDNSGGDTGGGDNSGGGGDVGGGGVGGDTGGAGADNSSSGGTSGAGGDTPGASDTATDDGSSGWDTPDALKHLHFASTGVAAISTSADANGCYSCVVGCTSGTGAAAVGWQGQGASSVSYDGACSAAARTVMRSAHSSRHHVDRCEQITEVGMATAPTTPAAPRDPAAPSVGGARVPARK